jgi:CRISPR system Cascade subunit CasD
MATLLLRLSAPIQAWGTQSHFSHRDTGREPSKSGVVGLLCAALGRPRGESLHDMAALRMGVRVDQQGIMREDFHTAGKDGYYKVDGKVERKNLITSNRFYLADARFLVGLEGDADLLTRLQAALQQPAWLLFLGRKACIPAERIWLPDGLQSVDLEHALESYPWLGRMNPPAELRVVIDDPDGPIVRSDNPLSFRPRRFLPRRMRIGFISNPSVSPDRVEEM